MALINEGFSRFTFPALETVTVKELEDLYVSEGNTAPIGGDETVKGSADYNGPFF